MIDEVLIEKILEGSEEAFDSLFNLYKNKVYKIAKITLHNDNYVEDILQEVFITVYKKIYTLKDVNGFDTWLYRIIINTCNAHFRKNKKEILSENGELESLKLGRLHFNIHDYKKKL